MVNLLVAAALAAAMPTSAPPPPADQPAMFVVGDADTTIYVFGTFHALDGQSQWLNPQVREAFEQSGELVLETVIPEGPQPIQATPGFRGPSVTPSASFLATTRMAISAGRSQGMQVGNGADMVLRHLAEAEGKPVEGLETLQLQLDMFNRMPASAAKGPACAWLGETVSAEAANKTAAAISSRRTIKKASLNVLDLLPRCLPATATGYST